MTALYVASPLGCSEAGRSFYHVRLLPLIRDAGYDVLDPWALVSETKLDAVRTQPAGQERQQAWLAVSLEIGATNREAIERSDGVVAVLDGVDVDSGTAFDSGGCAAGVRRRAILPAWRSARRGPVTRCSSPS